MAVDGTGKFLFGVLDETGLRTFVGNFNEKGHFGLATFPTYVYFTINVYATSLLSKGVTRNITETVKSTVNMNKSVIRTYIEPMHTIIATTTNFARTISTNVLLDVRSNVKLTREFVNELHVIDLFKRIFLYIFTESVKITISRTFKATLPREILVHMTPSHITSITRTFVETVKVTESVIRKRLFTFIETVKATITINKTVTRLFTETVKAESIFNPITKFIMKYFQTLSTMIKKGSVVTRTFKYVESKQPHKSVVIKLDDGRDLK